MLTWWRRILTRELSWLRTEARSALLWSLRITTAATASYVVGTLFFPGTQPLLAPLTAMLVVQVTPVSLLASGLDRVLAVVAGVSVAVGFSTVVPLQWWSLGLLILVSITIGQVLRLRSNLVEVAISGMLVLGVGSLSADSAAWQRIAETLVGAGVGIAANLLLPPRVASPDAGRAIDGLADSVSGLLARAADELEDLLPGLDRLGVAARGWLDEARRITHDIPRIGAALLRAEESRRLNVRAVGTADVGPGLRQGLEALEHSAVAIRGLFRAVEDATHDDEWLHEPTAEDVVRGLAQTFRELGAGIDRFGQLVRDEADHAARTSSTDVESLRAALDGIREARARLEDLLTVVASPPVVELHAAALSTVKRLEGEIDLDARIRRQVRLVRRPRPRRLPSEAEGPGETSTTEDETQVLPRVRRDRRDPPL